MFLISGSDVIWPELQGTVREVWAGLLCLWGGKMRSVHTNLAGVRKHEVAVSVFEMGWHLV